MLFTVVEDIELCKEFKVNPAQLMFIKMLVRDPAYDEATWRKRCYRMAMEYQRVIGGISAEDLADLVARDIIIDLNTVGNTHFDFYEINNKFAGDFELKVYPMPEQLYDLYPNIFEKDGKSFMGRTATPQEFALLYLKAINKNPLEHKQVIEDLKWAIKHGAIVCGIKKFVMTKYWEIIRKKRISTKNNISSVTIL